MKKHKVEVNANYMSFNICEFTSEHWATPKKHKNLKHPKWIDNSYPKDPQLRPYPMTTIKCCHA